MRRETLAIVGAGGFGREVAQLIYAINESNSRWDLVGFFDTHIPAGTEIMGIPVLGDNYKLLDSKNIDNIVIAVGSPFALHAYEKLTLNLNKKLPNLLHPSVEINFNHNSIGYGNIFTFGFFMTVNVKIDNLNIFNTRVTLGHDVKIGSANVFQPNVQVSGHVVIGNQNQFGMNSSVLQSKIIGSKNKIGAHSFVIKDILDEESVFGVPATKI